jgi:hypothetical protein
VYRLVIRLGHHEKLVCANWPGDKNLSDAIRELTHAQCTTRLYAQAARDAERLRNDPADLTEIKAVNPALHRCG